MRSERGAVSVMLLGTLLTIFLVLFMAMAVLAVGVFKSAYQVYGAAGNALTFAVYAADLDGSVSGPSRLTPDRVTPYFVYAFQKITGSAGSGVPGTFAGGDLPATVQITGLYPVTAGEVLPSGSVTNQPGFVVSLRVPVLTRPILGLPPWSVTVNRFAVVQPMPVN